MASKKSTPPVGASSRTAAQKPKGAAPPASVPKVQSTDVPKLKQKLVRDSFTIPKTEYAVLDALKQRATQLQRPAKKGEILRAGIAALEGLSDTAFVAALNAVPSLKTGRPKGAELTKASEVLPSAAQAPVKALAKAPAKVAAKAVAKSVAKAPRRALETAPVKAPAAAAAKVPMPAARKPAGQAVVQRARPGHRGLRA